MSSHSDSISPGSASSTADAAAARRGGSLRTVVLIGLLPLCLVIAAGISIAWVDARRVQTDLLRVFEELREVGLSRSLHDELHGIEQWIEMAPEATSATQALVIDDIRKHLAAARDAASGFSVFDDPSSREHDNDEVQVLARIHERLEAMEKTLAAGGPIRGLGEPLGVAMHAAAVMANTVDRETHVIAEGLDRRSDRLVQLLLMIGLGALVTMAWLAVLLVRRVLGPVRELRALAAAVGRGETGAVVVRYRDELGELADSFTAMAAQVRRSREQLEQRVEERSREVLRTARLAELGSMAAGIAHEVNNPIASIAACAEGLLRDGSPVDGTTVRDYLQIIRKEAMRTRDITARLLRFARHDAGKHENVWLGTELREVASMFAHQFADAGVRLELRGDAGGPLVRGDASELRQVLFNLLRNALDASPRGGAVRVACTAQGRSAVLAVEDDGPGIRPEDLDRVFEPFFTTKAPGKGTGLGLAIVHRIVTGHGGRIAVQDGASGGAAFRVELPLAPDAV